MSNSEFFLAGFLAGTLVVLMIFILARQRTKKPAVPSGALEAPPPSPETEAALSEIAQKTGAEIFDD